MDEELQKLLQADRDFSQMSAEAGASKAFSYYLTPDALQLPQDQFPTIGNVMKTEEGESLVWTPKNGRLSKSGDFGYTWGEYVFALVNGKQMKGKYVNIWVKQDDGSWKVVVDMGNSSPSE